MPASGRRGTDDVDRPRGLPWLITLAALVTVLVGLAWAGQWDPVRNAFNPSPAPSSHPSDTLENGYPGTASGSRPDRFVTVARQGFSAGLPGDNQSREALSAAAARQIHAVEVDVRMTADGRFVAAHDDIPPGRCLSISQTTLPELLRSCELPRNGHLATLDEILSLGFDEIYLDLKDTHAPEDRSWTLRAVRSAIDIVRAARRSDDVVIMIYVSPPPRPPAVPTAYRRLLDGTGLRTGLKLNPDWTADPHLGEPYDGLRWVENPVPRAIQLAQEHGFELVSTSTDQVTVQHLRLAAQSGVWILGSYVGPVPNVERWRTLARHGLGGLITEHYHRVQEDVAPFGSRPTRAGP